MSGTPQVEQGTTAQLRGLEPVSRVERARKPEVVCTAHLSDRVASDQLRQPADSEIRAHPHPPSGMRLAFALGR